MADVEGSEGGQSANGPGDRSCGVWGDSGSGVGVWGSSGNGTGIMGVSANVAGFFKGDVGIMNGGFSAPTKSFRIDHPLDPANRYLSHACVESADMKNLYDGTAELDGAGEALVELPAWFEALNESFRYQLTPVGAPAPSLHIAREMKQGIFKIAGGPPGLKVCWQVTGIRRDVFARAHPLIVEEWKVEDERGYFMHPQLYDQSAEKGIDWARYPELMSQLLRKEKSETNANDQNRKLETGNQELSVLSI